MTAGGGTFQTSLSRLRVNGLVDVTDEGMRASDTPTTGGLEDRRKV